MTHLAWFLSVLLPAIPHPSVELHQAYLDLGCDAVVMNISAHPDDEDGAALAFYRMQLGVKTYSVLFTRGEGGQNEKGPELYEDLAVLRSAETEAAGGILGAEVHFLNLRDFGYSKSATEAFRVWGGTEEPLRRLVWMIRKLRPDVLFTNHNTVGGHGHHQAAAVTALEAFDAASDSTRFPDQVQQLGVWQPRKLYVRAFGRAEALSDVSNDVGRTDPLRGLSYLAIANEALRQHRTQGMERADLPAFTRGRSLYRLVRNAGPADGDSTSFLGGVADALAPLSPSVERLRDLVRCIREGMGEDSLLLVSSMVLSGLDSLDRPPRVSMLERRLLDDWRECIERIISLTFDIRPAAVLSDSIVVPGQKVALTGELRRGSRPVEGVALTLDLPPGWRLAEGPAGPTGGDAAHQTAFHLRLGDEARPAIPRRTAQYETLNGTERPVVHFRYSLSGHQLTARCAPGLVIAPPQVVTIEPHVLWFRRSLVGEGRRLRYRVTNYAPRAAGGTLAARAPAGWNVESPSFAVAGEDSAEEGTILVLPPPRTPEGTYEISFSWGTVRHHLHVRVVDVSASPGVSVAIVGSYDTRLEETVRELGVPCRSVSDADLDNGNLADCSTLLIDIRAYLVREALTRNASRVLDYVAAGGNAVVMYQRELEWKPENAPYPFRVSRQRVSREDAPVDVLLPGHPLLHFPNAITAADWQGWTQERAVYMPTDAAPEYERLLSSHDEGDPPLSTGLLVSRWGKGSYIYTSFVWYRQLREKHPGALRWLANMISYGATRR